MNATADGKKNIIRFTFRQINESIDKYKTKWDRYVYLRNYVGCLMEEYTHFCRIINVPVGDLDTFYELLGEEIESALASWMREYYIQLEDIIAETNISELSEDFVLGLKERAFQDASGLVNGCLEIEEKKSDILGCLINEGGNDLFELFQTLYIKAVKLRGRQDNVTVNIFKSLSDIILRLQGSKLEKESFYISRMEAYEEMLDRAEELGEVYKANIDLHGEIEMEAIANSINTILDYSGVGEELVNSFTENIKKYKQEVNKNGSSDEIRKLRNSISNEFLEIYKNAFLNSVSDKELPTVLKMFFNFGYVDEELAGLENAVFLYHLAEHIPSDPSNGIYSYYEWLMEIYNGKKDPGRNEFDVDYAEYLHDEVSSHRITKEEEKELFENKILRVTYEIDNVFPIVNKTSTGRISTYCPVFSEHNLSKEPENMLVSAEDVIENLDRIKAIDFGAFFRQALYSNPENGVAKEYINIEVKPNIVLTPNIGQRAIMWQEIEGKRRTTPARMFLSIFQQEDISMQILRLVGQFRWEMCRREQGSRWNDVTDRSLTSVYFDYIQYFRKNKDLNAEIKEKIKNDLQRSKQNYREMFVRDYITWIQYESTGSPRLNKVSRAIMAEFVPFSKDKRNQLLANPMYKDLIEKYNLKQAAKNHRLSNLVKKLENGKYDIPREIINQIRYINS